MKRVIKLTRSEAEKVMKAYDDMTDAAFEEQVSKWKIYDIGEVEQDYKEMREILLDAFKKSKSNSDSDYILDLKVGITLYTLLNPESGFTLAMANDDDIWRYISMIVMPDITYLRYPKPTKYDSGRLNSTRFYSHTRRIWLKSLWWYIYLSWQSNKEDSYDALKENGTNIISHLIERPGKGYRLQLFRAIMRYYSTLPNKKDKLFRQAMKLNTARCNTIEPGLTRGGENEYSSKLFATFEI